MNEGVMEFFLWLFVSLLAIIVILFLDTLVEYVFAVPGGIMGALMSWLVAVLQ